MKSTSTAYILLVFLGGFGVHRFYLNRPITGFIYLFTLGLLGFGLFWDIFAIPGMVRAENEKFFNRPSSGPDIATLSASESVNESANQNAQNIVINVTAPVAPVAVAAVAPEAAVAEVECVGTAMVFEEPGCEAPVEQKNDPGPESPKLGVATSNE